MVLHHDNWSRVLATNGPDSGRAKRAKIGPRTTGPKLRRIKHFGSIHKGHEAYGRGFESVRAYIGKDDHILTLAMKVLSSPVYGLTFFYNPPTLPTVVAYPFKPSPTNSVT
jgi:hypothetical protein